MKNRYTIMVSAIILFLLFAACPAEASVFYANRFESSLNAPAEDQNRFESSLHAPSGDQNRFESSLHAPSEDQKMRGTDDAALSGLSEKKGLAKIKIELPKIGSDFHFDPKAEKEKLSEAIRALDEYGLTPEKLVERFWNFISRKENLDKIGEKTEELKEKTGDLIDKAKGEKNGDSGTGRSGNIKDNSRTGDDKSGEGTKDTKKSIDSGEAGDSEDTEKSGEAGNSENTEETEEKQGGESAVDSAFREIARVKKEVTEKAEKKLEEAAGVAGEKAQEKAAEEIDRAVGNF